MKGFIKEYCSCKIQDEGFIVNSLGEIFCCICSDEIYQDKEINLN